MGVKFGDNVIDGFMNVELFATEDVNEGGVSIRERVNADVAFGDYDESTDSPLRGILAGPIDESVGWADLVHPDDVRQLIQQVVYLR